MVEARALNVAEAIHRLKELHLQRGRLEKELADIGSEEEVLKNMPDVARAMIRKDERAMTILEKLRGLKALEKDVTYSEISGSKLTGVYSIEEEKSLYALQAAELITMSRSTVVGSNFRLTELGMDFNYGEGGKADGI